MPDNPNRLCDRGREISETRLAVVLLAALILAAMLYGCTSSNNRRVRASLGGGLTDLHAEQDSSGLTADIEGTATSLRVEVANTPEDIPVEVGLRMFGGLHALDESDQGVAIDLATLDLGAAVVMRPFLDLSDNVRLYGEGFAGYRHSWGDLSADGISVGSDDDGGLYFGAGGGLEFDLSRKTNLLIGVEWSRSMMSDAGVDMDIDDFMLTLGWSLSF